ncbi:FAD-binding oxidoreductase [Paenisporosarcina sp. TG20]|uniref:FAD-binding oxidoreductase n=1 Tax=Paenisporosarcina sp. TG20 TaxID=1211706 RepID=UPI00030BEF11|nr:FAD-binding oxidoreductase [Paenisporosarcina sp. TG20]
MIATELLINLESIIPRERIKSGQNQHHHLGNNAQVSVFPTTEEEISLILKYANNHGKKISVMGGGTKRGFGGLTESVDILLSLSLYKGIVEHTVGDMTLTVKAGTTFYELQEYLAKHKQKVSLDPTWPEYSTIGGIVVANENGPKRLGYGSSRDVVIGLRNIYPDGSIIRSGGKVVKNVAGYDMNKIFIGSMGTLGVVSEVTVKLRPVAKYESLILISFKEGSIDEILMFSKALLDSVMEPVALELLSPTLSEKLTGQCTFTVAISFEDVESSVHYQEKFVKGIQPSGTEMDILSESEAQYFWHLFYTICPNGAKESAGEETEAALKIGVVNLNVLSIIKESQLLQDSYNLVVESHGGLGHGLCQVILKGSSQKVVLAIRQMRETVLKLDGYLVVKHLPFELRQKVDVWGGKPSHFFLLEGIKSKIDPQKILNPKRFIGGI